MDMAHNPSNTVSVHTGSSGPVALTRDDRTLPRGHWTISGDILSCHNLEVGDYSLVCSAHGYCCTPCVHRMVLNSKGLFCTKCHQDQEVSKRSTVLRHLKCSLGQTSWQILVPKYESSQIPLPAQQAPQAWPSHLIGWFRCTSSKGLGEGSSGSCLDLSHLAVNPVPGAFVRGCQEDTDHVKRQCRAQII